MGWQIKHETVTPAMPGAGDVDTLIEKWASDGWEPFGVTNRYLSQEHYSPTGLVVWFRRKASD